MSAFVVQSYGAVFEARLKSQGNRATMCRGLKWQNHGYGYFFVAFLPSAEQVLQVTLFQNRK